MKFVGRKVKVTEGLVLPESLGRPLTPHAAHIATLSDAEQVHYKKFMRSR